MILYDLIPQAAVEVGSCSTRDTERYKLEFHTTIPCMLSTINRIEQCYCTAAAGVCYGGEGVATHLHLYWSVRICIVAYHTCNTEESTPDLRGHIV